MAMPCDKNKIHNHIHYSLIHPSNRASGADTNRAQTRNDYKRNINVTAWSILDPASSSRIYVPFTCLIIVFARSSQCCNIHTMVYHSPTTGGENDARTYKQEKRYEQCTNVKLAAPAFRHGCITR